MSKYTTGEIARLCNVSVRTVQYYDKYGLLTPSEYSEGGRRLYSNDDFKKLASICYLKDLGFSLKQVSEIMASEKSEQLITILLEEQKKDLQASIDLERARLNKVDLLIKMIEDFNDFCPEDLSGIAFDMENRKKLRRVHIAMVLVGIIVDLLWIGSLVYGIRRGNWLPFSICLPIALIMSGGVVKLYYDRTDYICGNCRQVFKPSFKEFLFSSHTPKTKN